MSQVFTRKMLAQLAAILPTKKELEMVSSSFSERFILLAFTTKPL